MRVCAKPQGRASLGESVAVVSVQSVGRQYDYVSVFVEGAPHLFDTFRAHACRTATARRCNIRAPCLHCRHRPRDDVKHNSVVFKCEGGVWFGGWHRLTVRARQTRGRSHARSDIDNLWSSASPFLVLIVLECVREAALDVALRSHRAPVLCSDVTSNRFGDTTRQVWR